LTRALHVPGRDWARKTDLMISMSSLLRAAFALGTRAPNEDGMATEGKKVLGWGGTENAAMRGRTMTTNTAQAYKNWFLTRASHEQKDFALLYDCVITSINGLPSPLGIVNQRNC
jgi:hypothetical protein